METIMPAAKKKNRAIRGIETWSLAVKPRGLKPRGSLSKG